MSRASRLAIWLGPLTVLVAVVYAQVVAFDFVSFDDLGYVVDNVAVQRGLSSWSQVVWAWTTIHYCWWHPVTWLSHMLDVQLYGDWAGGHHLTSVALHVVNTGLVGLLALRLGMSPRVAALAAALIMLHPTRVESVAWVSERKDVLCFMFGALTTLAWVEYRRSRGSAWYAALLVAYGFCLACKSALVTLPVVLLIAESWRAGRVDRVDWARRLFELVPLFVFAMAAGVLTMVAQALSKAVVPLASFGVGERLASVPLAYLTYLSKTLYPVDLMAHYPREPHAPLAYLAAAVGLGASLVLLTRHRRATWHALHGALTFGVMLLPTIGIVTVGSSFIADRYLYYPHVPFFFGAVLTLRHLVRRRRVSEVALTAAALAVVGWYTLLSHFQISTWRDSEALFSHALQLEPRNGMMLSGMGRYLSRLGRDTEARPYLEAASSYDAEAQALFARQLMKEGAQAEALWNGRRAVQRLPGSAVVTGLVSEILTEVGMGEGRAARFASAGDYLREACALSPSNQQACRAARMAEQDLAALEHGLAPDAGAR